MSNYSLKEERKALKGYIESCNKTEDSISIKTVAEGVKETHIPYLVCDFISGVPKAQTRGIMRMYEDEMEQIGDIVHSYEFMFLMSDMGVQTFDKKRFEELIKQSGNPKLMMYCLGFVEGIDQESMLQALYETKNAKYIELLSTNEDYEGLNVTERPEYYEMLERAKKFKFFPQSLEEYRDNSGENPNLVNLISSVLKSDSETVEQKRKKAYQINELANYLEYLSEYHGEDYDTAFLHTSINLLQDAELVAGDDEPLHLYEFAASVETDDKSGIINRIIDIGDKKYINYCLQYVPNVPQNLVEKIEKALKAEEASKTEKALKTEEVSKTAKPTKSEIEAPTIE